MKMAFALLFFFGGSIDESKTVYYKNLQSCRFMCQELSKEQRNYQPTQCICKLVWVDKKARVIQ
jgi:hypothetical protein